MQCPTSTPSQQQQLQRPDCVDDGYRVSQLVAVAGALGICQWPKNESYAFLNETVFWVIYCHYVCGRFRVHITDCIVALNLPPT